MLPNMRRRAGARVALSLAAAVVVMSSSATRGATTPSSQSFDGLTPGTDISPSGFTESAAVGTGVTNDYTLTGTALLADVSATGTTGTGASRSAGLQLLDLGGVTNAPFRLSTNFVLNSFASPSTSTINFGLAFLDADANFSDTTQYRVLYTPTNGRLTIQEVGSGVGGLTATVGTASANTVTSEGSIPATGGLSGSIAVDGTYAGGVLTLSATLISGATTLTASGTDLSPQTGNFFGYRTAVNAVNGTAAENVTYDNFSATSIPEPTGSALIGGAVAGLVARRRRTGR